MSDNTIMGDIIKFLTKEESATDPMKERKEKLKSLYKDYSFDELKAYFDLMIIEKAALQENVDAIKAKNESIDSKIWATLLGVNGMFAINFLAELGHIELGTLVGFAAISSALLGGSVYLNKQISDADKKLHSKVKDILLLNNIMIDNRNAESEKENAKIRAANEVNQTLEQYSAISLATEEKPVKLNKKLRIKEREEYEAQQKLEREQKAMALLEKIEATSGQDESCKYQIVDGILFKVDDELTPEEPKEVSKKTSVREYEEVLDFLFGCKREQKKASNPENLTEFGEYRFR